MPLRVTLLSADALAASGWARRLFCTADAFARASHTRSGRAAAVSAATVFACCWKMPFTTVAASPTVTVIARLFLSPLVAWMPTPACAMPAGKKRTREG